MLVLGAVRPELKKGEVQVSTRVVFALLLNQSPQRHVVAMQRFGVPAQALPDPLVGIRRADVRFARLLIVNDVDALHRFERNAPIGTVLADYDLQLAERMVDLVVPGKGFALVGLFKDRGDCHLG